MSEAAYQAIVLASSSPRRRELLEQIGVTFDIDVPEVDETPLPDEAPRAYVERVARNKVQTVLGEPRHERDLVIGSDTSVIVDGGILGKPVDFSDFSAMMQSLSGRSHEVMTAVAVADRNRCAVDTSISKVRFRPITASEITAYWRTGEPCDKAGGYAIQGIGAMLIAELRGSFSGVMGLPLHETAELMAGFGVDLWKSPS